MNVNDEIVLNPRVNCYFEIYSAPNCISFLQHNSDGTRPIAIFNSLDKSVEFFGDPDIPNLYKKTETDAIDDELSALILNTYTKTEIDTQLTDYTSITYLQDNYMTTLALTEALTNNYASIALLDANFYDETYLNNQFSLKADVSELTSIATADYLEFKYTNSVDLTIDYYKKTDTDNMLLSYSTGSC